MKHYWCRTCQQAYKDGEAPAGCNHEHAQEVSEHFFNYARCWRAASRELDRKQERLFGKM